MKLRISVTKEILEKSKDCGINDCYISENCAITLAVQDIFPKAKTEYETISLSNGTAIALPEEATNFIYRFDAAVPEERVKMSPISFEVDVPDEVINRINIGEIEEVLKNHPTLQFV